MSKSTKETKTYYVRINCAGFQDFKVTGADTRQEAISQALRHSNCDCTEGEFCEMVAEENAVLGEEIDVKRV